MNIKIDLKELKEFKRVFKSDFIKVTATSEGIELYTYESKIELIKTVEGIVIEEGTLVIKSWLVDLLPPGEVNLTDDFIGSNDTIINFENDYTATYPRFEVDEVLVSNVESGKFKEIFSIKYAVAECETRPVLKNIMLNEDFAVALDGYRLAEIKTGFELEKEILIPIDAVKLISKLKGEGTIGTQGQCTIFKVDKYQIRFADYEGEYIKHKHLIDKDYKIVCKVDSSLILNTLKRAKKVGGHTVNINISNNIMILSMNRFDIRFVEKLNVECNGEIGIAFNINYLIDVFKASKGEVKMELQSNVTPVLIKQEGKVDLVLPIKINK